MKLDYHILKPVANAFLGMFIGRKAVLFNVPHAVFNTSNELRAVLIVDVRRPLPLIADLCNRFVIDVIARHTHGRSVTHKAEAFASARSAQRNAAA